ncbi:MAG TPA: DEAD/DEAH box helicase [Stellaceae bacterium]|nr:DEAD/DEAH box helicase [Stellaceae bacterium]
MELSPTGEQPAPSFADFDLNQDILRALRLQGFTQPTPIQAEALPIVLSGRDLIGSAQTGTGKTAAFMLPALQRISNRTPTRLRGPRVLVLAPTRELAQQIIDTARKLGQLMRVSTVPILGGMPYRTQLQMLSRPIDLMVATPGRLIDHLDRDRVSLADLEMLVLDEADRMLDMGFTEAVDRIVSAAPATRQTLLFTATMDKRMAGLAQRMLKDPARVAIEAATLTVDRIDQRLHVTDDLTHKRKLLAHWAASPEVGKAIIFAATKRDADQLAQDLSAQGHKAGALHGDLHQAARMATIRRLRSGEIKLLVATDVAARGIDVPDITHVINFDLPRQAEDYVHRIGRTGRAGASGIAISFVAAAERGVIERIERYTGSPLTHAVVEGLEPRTNLSARGPRGPSKGGWNKNGRPQGRRPWQGNRPAEAANGEQRGPRQWTPHRERRPA